MAVPVINTVSKTKSTGITRLHSTGHTVGSPTSTWSDISEAPELPSVADGTTVWMKASSYSSGSSSHNDYQIRVVGVTSGSVLYELNTRRTNFDGSLFRKAFMPIGFNGIVKNTGATENLKVQFKNSGSSTGYFNGYWSWGTGILNWIPFSAHDKVAVIKTTMQIDEIDVFAVNSDTSSQCMIPEIGAVVSTNTDMITYTPNKMVNQLSVIPVRTTTAGNYYAGEIAYTYTGKELSMS
jgi:hypothetical protein